jgi:hypothetical protein
MLESPQKPRRRWFCFGLEATLLLVAIGCGGPSPPTQRPLPSIVPAESLVETDVVPHTEGMITPGRNYVYCVTFQMAWDEMEFDIFKEPVVLAGPPPLAEILNRHSRPAVKLDDRSYLARAGFADARIVADIRREISEKFPSADIKIPDADPKSVVAYAFLEKSLPFKEAFDRLSEPITFMHAAGSTQVAAFGIRGEAEHRIRLLRQIVVLSYASDDDFVLRLKASAEADELVLAKVAPEETLSSTIESVKRRVKEHPPQGYLAELQWEEAFAVPVVSLGVLRRYTELEGRDLENSPWRERGYKLVRATQGIQFRLDETGASLSSSAGLAVASAPAPKPRKFILDRPFLLYLQSTESSEPYFALWIETPELLAKFGR